MIEKKIKYHEVRVRFLVKKGSYSAETVEKLANNVFDGIGGNEMGCIEAEWIQVFVDDKKIK